MPNSINRYLRITVWPENATEPLVFNEDWKIVFRIRKFASANFMSYNTAEIDIYNMKSETRELLSQKYLKTSIDSGYYGNHATVFGGRIYNVLTTKQTTELITKLYCVGDLRAFEDMVNICVQNVSVTDLIAQECQKHGISYRLPFKRSDIVKKSYTGSFSKVIAMICYEYKISCTIDNGQLVFRDLNAKNQEVNEAEIKVITPTSGLLGNPTTTNQGTRFKALMQPCLQVNDYVRLEAPYSDYNLDQINIAPGMIIGKDLGTVAHVDTRSYNGIYLILSLIVSGDTRGNDWYTEVEGSRPWLIKQNAG